MKYFIYKSLILEYWIVLLPIIISLIFIIHLKRKLYSKSVRAIKSQQKPKNDNQYKEIEDLEEDEDEKFIPSLEEKEHIYYKGATKTLIGGAQKFYEIMNDRRSVRNYSTKSVPYEIIETCIKVAGTSPSGAHTEPWTFCVISSPIIKTQIREIIEFEEYINYSQRMHKQWTTDLKPLKTCEIKPYLEDAPYLILIFKQIYGININGKRKQHYYNEISVSIAIGILLCAFQTAGLSSLVTTPLNCGPALKNLLQRPENEKLLVLLPVGYPSEDCKVPDLQRKDVNEIIVKY